MRTLSASSFIKAHLTLRRAGAASAVLLLGAAVFVGRLAYERYMLHLPASRLFFTALHAELAWLYGLSIMCFLIAHVWVLLMVLSITVQRGRWWRLAPVVAFIALQVLVGWIIYP